MTVGWGTHSLCVYSNGTFGIEALHARLRLEFRRIPLHRAFTAHS